MRITTKATDVTHFKSDEEDNGKLGQPVSRQRIEFWDLQITNSE
jgi:hypothetical protein